MNWMNDFYDASIAIPVSLIAVAFISILSWRKQGRQLILVLTMALYARYLAWRGLYTLNTEDWESLLVSGFVYSAEMYAFVQMALFAYHAWAPLERKSVPLTGHPTVDIFVPIVNEPVDILRRTLTGCTHQDYPRDRYRVYVLDDGHRDEVRHLATSLGCGYIQRVDRLHAKAGNLNHALQQTNGDIIAIFDVDHVPTSDFLHETVGFFQDEQVAIVQTPHHFYNPDIFQRNLRNEKTLKNEQSLFYRVLQSGRDRSNSAFFAGSCGLLCRSVLEKVGGFRTETVTEDIHTSMVIHAKGYRSCYLNKVLAAGLMPESFESSIKQRVRWATGHIQILFRTNPFTMRGLSLPQRIGYFASIFYFCHGIPRLICLVAPLFALLFGLTPVMADVPAILNYFGSYYVATLVMLRTVSRGTRNAFWSDVYETADSVALSWATVKTALSPRKPRPFVITPKGIGQENRGLSQFYVILPHLLIMGLLLMGLITGLRLWLEEIPTTGLGVSLFWGSVNLLLVSVSILAAAEVPEWRGVFRIKRRSSCEIVAGMQRVKGLMLDVNETGARVRLRQPIQNDQGQLRCILKDLTGSPLELDAMICRQQQLSPSMHEIGLRFVNVTQTQVEAVIALAFLDSVLWNQAEKEPGIFQSLWSVFRSFRKMVMKSRASYRRQLRRPYRHDCRLAFRDRILTGTVDKVSQSGLSVYIPGTADHIGMTGMLYVDSCSLRVQRKWVQQCEDRVLAGFTIERVEKGAVQWQELTAQAA